MVLLVLSLKIIWIKILAKISIIRIPFLECLQTKISEKDFRNFYVNKLNFIILLYNNLIFLVKKEKGKEENNEN